MIEEAQFKFTQSQIAGFAFANVRSLALAAVTYCRDHDQSPDEYWCYMGCQFADAWDWVKSTEDLVFGIIGNLLSLGFELLSVTGDEYEYNVEVIGWPTDPELDHYDLKRDETEVMWKIFIPICDEQAHDFTWKRDGAKVTFTVTRR